MLKRDLIKKIAKNHNLKQPQAKAIVDDVFSLIEEGLLTEDHVQISGFGTFERVPRPSRMTRNPYTGERIKVSPGLRGRFRIASRLKKALNQPDKKDIT